LIFGFRLAAQDLAANSNVQDAFVIAVEKQARERLERLSALKKIKPVDMTKLSQQVTEKEATLIDSVFFFFFKNFSRIPPHLMFPSLFLDPVVVEKDLIKSNHVKRAQRSLCVGSEFQFTCPFFFFYTSDNFVAVAHQRGG
jgi:hypothetical protein